VTQGVLEGEAAWLNERAACGVGFVASRHGRSQRSHLDMALHALSCVEHRGACGADQRSSDGAGIMTDIPFGLLGREKGSVAVAALLVPLEAEPQRKALAVFQQTFAFFGLDVVAFRDVPVDTSVLGAEARRTMPAIIHAIIRRPDHCRTDPAFNNLLYAAKQLTRTKATDLHLPEFYFASLSTNTIIYKALTRAEDLGRFYRDLQEPGYATRFALFHRRFSTNTRTSWDKAQPFRVIAHNGEINTIAGNRSWAFSREKSLGLRANELLTHHGISDTGSLNEMVEALLYRSSIPRVEDVMAILMPPAGVPHSFYRFWARAMEPWDGPAFITYSDGLSVGARLDRNGFRPCRWVRTPDHFFLASEAGAFQVDESIIEAKGRLAAGSGVKVHLADGAIDFTDPGASQENMDAAYDARLIPLRARRVEVEAPALATQRLFGWTEEDVERVLVPMTVTGKEPLGSMGDTARPAVLSSEPRSLFDYFHQDFAQVTNPPVDYLRETNVTDLSTALGRKPNPFSPKELIPPPVALELSSPVLSLGHVAQLLAHQGPNSPDARMHVHQVDMVFPARHGAVGFSARLDDIRREVVAAVRAGANVVVLSDASATPDSPPIPSLLVLRAVVNELNESGNRLDTSLVMHSAEVTNAHRVAALVAFGAAAVCPYLALQWARAGTHEALGGMAPDVREQNLVRALEVGLLKVMSKMGISVVRSYHSARLFSAVGIGAGLVREFFPGLYSPIGGMEIPDVVDAVLANAARAVSPSDALVHTYQFKENARGRMGEHHSMTASRSKLIHQLVRSTGLGLTDLGLYDAYLQHAQNDAPVNLRHLLEVSPAGAPLDASGVQPASAILARFGSGAMSFGAISAESQRDIFVAMKRVGGRSNSGEGGENPYAASLGVTASTRQVASARFGVTAAYLTAGTRFRSRLRRGPSPVRAAS
jgi:glutamate synthase domain-containing protein 1